MKKIILLLIPVLFSCQTSKTKYSDLIGREYNSIEEISGFSDYKFVLGCNSQDGQKKVSIYRDHTSCLIAIEKPSGNTKKIAVNIFPLNNIENSSKFDFGVCNKSKPEEKDMIIHSTQRWNKSEIKSIVFIDFKNNTFTEKKFEEAKDCLEVEMP